ncbi:hypothetical protein WKW80_34820 [Variovorax humicola]|uniref:Uncharacterized protein n=1 Tax=Variovorax humicola TaxID=1769758 RepID=A0ABU8WCV2_9BURK
MTKDVVRQWEKIFGKDMAQYLHMIDALALNSQKTRYSFTENEQFETLINCNHAKAMQTYCGEILARSHLGAVTSILRSRRWITAVLSAFNQTNLLAFAAALRGFIESAADSSTSLGSVPLSLATNNDLIVRALSGSLGEGLVSAKELEDALIHFAFARHVPKAEFQTTPPSHNAKHVREYIKILEEGGVPGVLKCYQTVCDLTHPGMSSVWMWLRPRGDLEFELNPNQEASDIAGLLREYVETIQKTAMFAFNPGVVTLRVLNYFPIEHFHTSGLMTWNLSGFPLWQKCLVGLNGAPPRNKERPRMVR